MKIANKNFFWVIALLLLSGAVAWFLFFKEYRQSDTVSISKFPMQFGEWKGSEVAISVRDYEMLETHNTFIRKYRNLAGDEIYLFIVYSQNNRKVSHPPEICYIGAGASILDKRIAKIPDLPKENRLMVNRLVVEHLAAQQVICYWFKVGNKFTPNYWQQQIWIAVKSLLGKPESSALIRVGILANDRNFEKSDQLVFEFVREILPLFKVYLP